jgi:phage shock protein E
MKSITPEELKQALEHNTDDNRAVIDVRTAEEFAQGHIKGAINIPVTEIDQNVEQLQTYDTLYINCRSGGRSQKGCQRLQELGLNNVVNVEGGILAWEKSDLPIEY